MRVYVIRNIPPRDHVVTYLPLTIVSRHTSKHSSFLMFEKVSPADTKSAWLKWPSPKVVIIPVHIISYLKLDIEDDFYTSGGDHKINDIFF